MGNEAQDQAGEEPTDNGPAASEAPAPEAHEAGESEGPDDEAHDLPDEVEYPGTGSGLPPRVERWRRRSATGAMMTGFALGLREVLETEHREPAIVLETSGVPPRDLAVEADLDNVPPRQSVVKVRRWLLTEAPESGADVEGPSGPTGGDKAPARPTEIRKRAPRRSRASRIFGPKGS